MLGETEPERRYLHVAVCLEHYILVLFGNRCETIKILTYDVHTALPANVIWMYNLYTGQWRKAHNTRHRKSFKQTGVIDLCTKQTQ